MFKDLWEDLPWQFKIVWAISALTGLAVIGLIITVLVKLVIKL